MKLFEKAYELSPMQQGMLFHAIGEPGSGVDIEQIVCQLDELLDTTAMLRAWDLIASRHTILRTAFIWEGIAEPLQQVHDSVQIPSEIIDWRGADAAEQAACWDRLLAADRKQGFGLSCAPLMRLHIVQLGESSYRLLWTFHHALLDGRSFPIVLREVFAAYTAFRDGVLGEPQLATRRPYYDYIEWLQTQDVAQADQFFREKLKGFRAPTPIPSSVSGDAGAWGVAQCRLSEELTKKLSAFAQTIGVTVNTLLQGAWALLLHHHSGEEDIVFGATRSGRASTLNNDNDAPVGLFINTLPMRISVRPEVPVCDWLREIREQHVSLRPYEQTPLRTIQKASEVPGGVGLFNSILVFENYLLDTALRAQGGEWAYRHFEYIGQTNFPLTLIVYADREMILRLEHDPKQLDSAGAKRVLGHLRTLLEGMCVDAARAISRVPFLTEAETRELLAPPRAASQVQINDCLHQRFERQVTRTPESIAVTCDGESLTYRELSRRANAVANRLVALGAGPEVLIGLCVERNLGMVVGILGILKAGAAYLPIDLSYPPERVAFMLEDAGVAVLLSELSLEASLPKHQAAVLFLDDVTDGVDETPATHVQPENLAYVIYTSGSTGKPKGCQITHANAVRLFDQTDHWYGFQPSDVWTLFHSCAFDFSVWEIWGALLYGGKLVVVPYWVSRSPEAFAELLRRERVTVLNQTPSAFRQLTPFVLGSVSPAEQTLRYVIFGGEALELASLLPWMEQYGDSKPRLINMYGITETTVHVTYRPITLQEVRAGSGSLIGEPIPDLAVYVLNPQGQPVPMGVAGEMYVGGAGVARGYLRRPELTAQHFIESPFAGSGRLYRTGDLARRLPNGDLEYLGRIDHQVKIRGFRIELGEIESVISLYLGIREVVVIAREDKPGDKKLVAYYCAAQEIAHEALRAHMKVRLPDYMVPAAFMRMDALPLTSNGKVDRRALPAPDVSRASRKDTYVAPRTPAEQTLARIWAEVLGIEAPGVHDNFFELGGDSILSIQVISRARQAGLAITPRELFQSPTIAELAAAAPQVTNAPPRVEAASGEVALTPIQRWFFAQPLEDRNYWNQTFLFTVPPEIDVDRLEQALTVAVAHHDAFRLRFVHTSSGWRQTYTDQVPSVTIERADDLFTQSEILDAAGKTQGSLDIAQGPLLAAMFFPMGPEKPGRLLLTVHHLAIDGVSWRLLLEDVESAYWSLEESKQIALPSRTASYKAWSAALGAYAERPEVQAQSAYWQTVADATAAVIPVDHATGLNTEESTETVTATLTADQTELLLRQIPAVYHSQINDLLLTALAESFRPWTGRESLLVDVEGHGRQDIGAVDVSRTIGWFTSIYPVRLSLKSGVPLDASLQAIKDQLRQIPDKGIGYGLLRDLITGLPQVGLPQANVLFNYLGQFDQVVAGSRLFSFASESVGLWHHPKGTRTHLIEVLARIAGGQLEVQFNFSRNVHSRATMEQIAARYSAALMELIKRSNATDAQRWSVANFTLAKLEAAELAGLLKSHSALEDIYPLSPMQKLFHSMEASTGQLGFEQWRFVLRGSLDTAALRRSWERVIDRHPILRTAFVSHGLQETVQVVLPARPLEWTEIDLRDSTEDERQQRLLHVIAADRATNFDLGVGQLLRIVLLRIRDDEWQMVWSTHHLLIDGWSWPVIFKELSEFYTGKSALPKPRAYRDYIAWTLGRSTDDAQNFWHDYLKDFAPQPLRIGQRPAVAPVTGHALFGREKACLEEDITQELQNTARENQVTLNTVLQGAWALVLSHYQNSTNPVFGAAYSGRPPEISGIEGMVGPCVNNLPVRANITAEMPTSSWLKQLQREQFNASQHQYNSIEQIQSWSGIPWRHRLFDSLIVFQNYASGGATERLSESVTIEVADAPESTNYPLTLTVVPDGKLRLKMLYRLEQFEATNIRRILSDLGAVLRAIAKTPGAKLSEMVSQLAPPPEVAVAGIRSMTTAGTETTPRTDMERTVAGIWQELFDTPRVSLEANFFDLGGHSLLLVQAHRKLQQALGRNLPIVTLLQHPTVRSLARQLAGNGDSRLAAQAVNERARRQQEAMTRMKMGRKG